MTLEEQEALSSKHPKAPSRQEPSLAIPAPAHAGPAPPLLGLACSSPPVYTYPIKMTVSELGISLGRITRDLHKLSQYDPVPDPPRPSCSADAVAAAVTKAPVAAAAGDASARSPAPPLSSPTRPQTEPALPTTAAGANMQRTPSKSILRPSKPSLHEINMHGDYRWRSQALNAKPSPAAAVKRVKSAKSVRFLVVQGHHTDSSAC